MCNVITGREVKSIPVPILTYNKYMGGVDLHDQHRAYYPVGRPCRKWWRYLFWFLVQSCLVNAFTIFKLTNRPAPRSRKLQDPLHFRLAVFHGLIRGNVARRAVRILIAKNKSLMGQIRENFNDR